MMSVRWSRTAERIGDGRTGAAMGTWGLWLALVVLLLFVAGMATAALYLETGRPGQDATGRPEAGAWPPAGVEVPTPTRAMVAFGALLLAALLLGLATRRVATGATKAGAGLVLLSVVVEGGGAALLVADLLAAPFRWDEHAYTSVYWVLTATAILFAVVGVLMAFGVLLQLLTGVVEPRRHLELRNSAWYLVFVSLTAAILLGLVHGLPHTGGAP